MDNLRRFLDGQRFGYDTALKEMKAGEKHNHWIWSIQLSKGTWIRCLLGLLALRNY